MFQQLAQDTGAQAWVVAALVFFVVAFTLVLVRVFRTPAAVHRANAQLPLHDELDASEEASSSR